MFRYLFCPKIRSVYYRKISTVQEWLVVGSCPTPCWIAFLMFYQLVYNTLSFQWTNFGLKYLLEDKEASGRDNHNLYKYNKINYLFHSYMLSFPFFFHIFFEVILSSTILFTYIIDNFKYYFQFSVHCRVPHAR